MIENLGKKLESLRISSKLSRKQVAELLGISVSMVGLYETDQRLPSLKILIKLAAHYKVSVDYLLGTHIERNVLSLDGLTDKQIQVLKQTVECFRSC